MTALPPGARSRTAHVHTRAAAEGRFVLQRCAGCGAFAFPARDACPKCLSAGLHPVDAPRSGTLLSETTIRVPVDLYFRARAPWRIGLVQLGCGPTMVAHLHAGCRDGEAVRMSFQLDRGGNAVAVARPLDATPDGEDRQLREMVADPRSRRALVTDGRTPVGQAVAAALAEAGAAVVVVGVPDPAQPFPGDDVVRALPGIRLVPLDLSAPGVSGELAADLDILVHTADDARPGGLLDLDADAGVGVEAFVRLVRAFGPALRDRAGSDGGGLAWVNILSVYALANWPAFGAYSAAQAACLSLSQCLRAELRPGGVRVVNLFTGPLDTAAFGAVPPPRLAPRAVAAAVVAALRAGTEDVFVGDVAEDIRRRLAANPKALERELGSEVAP